MAAQAAEDGRAEGTGRGAAAGYVGSWGEATPGSQWRDQNPLTRVAVPFVRIHDILPIHFWIRTTEFGMCQSFCWGLSPRLNFCKCCYYRSRIFFPKWCNPEIWGLKKDTCISFNSVSSPKHLEENIFSICMSPALRWPSSSLVMRWKVQECSSPGSRCPCSDGHRGKGALWLVQRVFCPGRWHTQSEGETTSDLESSSEVFKWRQGDLIQVLCCK